LNYLSNRGFALRLFAVLLVLLLTLSLIPAEVSSEPSQTGRLITRTVPMTIKIVLIGFDPLTVDLDYLTWKGNVVQKSVNNILDSGNITGISYNLNYEFVFSTPDFQTRLTEFLGLIQERKLTYNPWFKALTVNYFYDAAKVEDWLIANNASYGGFPTHGYTFVFANLTSLPSITEGQLETENPMNATPHYYKEQFVDKDLDYRIRYRDFSVAWGGKSRLWYLDFAAGPEFWTWASSEAVPHIPMQLALDLFRVNVHTPQGKEWLTQFLADYVYDAVLNLAVPVFTYQPTYSHTYRIVVNIIDNRTDREKETVPIEDTIHPEIIKKAFTDLLPYSVIQVETQQISANDSPRLQAAIINSTVTPPSDLGIDRYVDTRPIYRYLQEHLSEFVGTVRRDSIEFTVPIFAFAFRAGIYFGYTYKWYVASLKSYDSSFSGISLGDMVLIGSTQLEFQRGDHVNPTQPGKGIGFTQMVIHEAGHSLGLMHPHQFGYLGDFESSAMSYWSWEYKFSQFDKDAINRAHADQLINSALVDLSDAQTALSTRFDMGVAENQITSAKDLLDRALEKYDLMQYVQAVEIAVVAEQTSTSALATVMSLPNAVATVALLMLVAGIVIGSSVLFMALRKYVHELSERR